MRATVYLCRLLSRPMYFYTYKILSYNFYSAVINSPKESVDGVTTPTHNASMEP